ncbi:MAG: Heparinase family protein, partial [Betaproteobacteria bacterium]|nr:Heparinase family protein [Betaproteobacteria bacterium]
MTGTWAAPARRKASLVERERFCLLNQTHALSDRGWDDEALDKLWRYHLHYFDDLNAEGADSRTPWHRELIERWVRENPPAAGSGWEPYPTSLRIVNWIKWALAGNALPQVCADSLAAQARWLSRRLEIHLLGNHLFANAKALLFAGVYFDGREAQGWQDKALLILAREIPEQILGDGGHFERSTMYHALALEDMLDLCNVVAAYPNAAAPGRADEIRHWREQVGPMRAWLAAMCHPDGEIAFFNDAALGIAPARVELEDYASRLAFLPLAAPAGPVIALGESGYVRVDLDAAVALLDVAPVGPDYLPGHAHADTLSFELSVFGQRVFVNSGTSCYGGGAERLRQRGTAAHNTVVVDGKDSSEVWGGFRVARRARPLGLEIAVDDAIEVRCAHDGYARPRREQEHRRQWRFGDCELVVEDTVTGDFDRAQARFHLHPAIAVPADGAHAGGAVLQIAGQRDIEVRVEGGVMRIEPSTWHPEFGRSIASLCLVVDFTAAPLRTRIDWKHRP